MTNIALLNNVEHPNLKVITGHSAEFGDNINQALIFPTEFGDIQREYPILFLKDANGEFQSVALLGLDKDENLFLTENGWEAQYVPAVQQRGPFMIGLQKNEADGETQQEPMIHIDLDHARVGATEGEPVFLPHGGNSPYLEYISRVLRVMHQGMNVSKAMFDAFEEFDLIAPVTIELKLSETEQITMPDRYTISEEKLAGLDGAKLEQLHRAGFLHAAFLVLSSMGNVSKLLNMKNRARSADH